MGKWRIFLAVYLVGLNLFIEIDKNFNINDSSIVNKTRQSFSPKFVWVTKEGVVDLWSVKMIEVVLNDRLGKKVRVKCNEDDNIYDLKKLVAAQIRTRADKIRIQKWYIVYKDHITLKDYEIHDGMGLELYYY